MVLLIFSKPSLSASQWSTSDRPHLPLYPFCKDDHTLGFVVSKSQAYASHGRSLDTRKHHMHRGKGKRYHESNIQWRRVESAQHSHTALLLPPLLSPYAQYHSIRKQGGDCSMVCQGHSFCWYLLFFPHLLYLLAGVFPEALPCSPGHISVHVEISSSSSFPPTNAKLLAIFKEAQCHAWGLMRVSSLD